MQSPQLEGLSAGPRRNYQLLSPLEFLAEFTQHIPPQGAHLIRYYGWYSNKARGLRKKAAAAPSLPSPVLGRGAAIRSPGEGIDVTALVPPPTQASSLTSQVSPTWAMLIKRVYEVDPLECPKCSGAMKVVAFIEPPQADVIERIMAAPSPAMVGGLWNPSAPRPPPGDSAESIAPNLTAPNLAATAQKAPPTPRGNGRMSIWRPSGRPFEDHRQRPARGRCALAALCTPRRCEFSSPKRGPCVKGFLSRGSRPWPRAPRQKTLDTPQIGGLD